MKNALQILLLLVFVACSNSEEVSLPTVMLTSNALYTSPEGRFEAFFPHKPLISYIDGEVDGKKLINYVFVHDTGKEKYAVNYADYPDSSLIDLEKIKNKGLRAMGEVSIIEEKSVQLGSYKGIQYRANVKNGIAKANVAGKLLAVGNRLYYISVFTSKELPENTSAFLDSFTLVN
ncbi:MAG: hypothetical protein MUE81_18060 [Thermoflexibacter sp.]|jgi:hypothetical protein|nr:hypothetical protein [Thermoflexibacter sp.]